MSDPLELADFYDLTLVSDLAVAPGGDRVAFVADEFDPDAEERKQSLFTVPADGSESPHRLTRASDASQPTWSPDGRYLGFIAAREDDTARQVSRDEDGDETTEEGTDGTSDDEEPKPQVWAFDLARGGDARQLTDRDEGVRGFDWGPKADRIVIASRDPTEEEQAYLERRREEDGPIETERLQHKADGTGWLDDVTTYLFVVDLESEETTRLDDAYGAGAYEPLLGLQPAWGANDRIAFVSNRTDRPDDSAVMDLFTIEPDGDGLRRVTDGDLRVSVPEWGPEGDRLAFIGGHPTNWYRPDEVYVADDPASGRYHSVSGSLDRTTAWFSEPRWIDPETLLCPFGDEGWVRLVRLEAAADAPERVFDGLTRDRSVVFSDVGGGTVAVSVSDPETGHDVYTMDIADLDAPEDRTTTVTDLNGDLLAGTSMPTCHRLTFDNGDGDTIHGLAYVPDGFDPESPSRHPTIAVIHGGPMSYDAPGFGFDHTYWTGQGYVVLRVNYRGSTSYGREFSEQLRGTRGGLESDDVVSGVEHLVEQGWADPERLFVTGFSYGGITSAHIVTRTDMFAAAAPEHGVYDFYSLFGTDDNHLWHEDEFGLPWRNQETYRDISSLTDVDEIETPLLVTAGEEDWRCPPTQAEQLYVSVRKRGVDAKLVIYPGEHHNVGDPDRAIHRFEQLTEWFERHDPAVDRAGSAGSES